MPGGAVHPPMRRHVAQINTCLFVALYYKAACCHLRQQAALFIDFILLLIAVQIGYRNALHIENWCWVEVEAEERCRQIEPAHDKVLKRIDLEIIRV